MPILLDAPMDSPCPEQTALSNQQEYNGALRTAFHLIKIFPIQVLVLPPLFFPPPSPGRFQARRSSQGSGRRRAAPPLLHGARKLNPRLTLRRAAFPHYAQILSSQRLPFTAPYPRRLLISSPSCLFHSLSPLAASPARFSILAARCAGVQLPQRVPELVDLRETMEEVVPEQRARLAEIKAKYGDMVLGDVTVNMVRARARIVVPRRRIVHSVEYASDANHECALLRCVTWQAVGGMRGIKGLLWETSQLDPLKLYPRLSPLPSLIPPAFSSRLPFPLPSSAALPFADAPFRQGIKFRGLSIPECQAQLPSALDGGQPLPEALLWLLLTGERHGCSWVVWRYGVFTCPTAVRPLNLLFSPASSLNHQVPTEEQAVSLAVELQDRARLPAVLALQRTSKFAAAYHRGTHKRDLWRHALDDSLDLIAALPEIAARIYNRSCKEGGARPGVRAAREDLDYAGNLAHMMGFDDERMDELLRLYLTIHADHEGGNVSAHATHLVGSALSDPFLALSAGLNGLAGPLHGLANQEVLGWLHALRAELGERPSKEQLGEHVRRGLAAGRVVPGYGHAVLRVTDPRYSCQREFAWQHMAHDPMVQLVSDLYEVVPPILQETGKVQNPWPNVDAHSGVLLQHLGLTHANFYTVLFGVSRDMGDCLPRSPPPLLKTTPLHLPLSPPSIRPIPSTSFYTVLFGVSRAMGVLSQVSVVPCTASHRTAATSHQVGLVLFNRLYPHAIQPPLPLCYSTAVTLITLFITLFLALSDDLSPSPSASPTAAATAAPAATTASHSQQH
ncbi:unnamed protein product [Closterium sp. NIES-53]